MSKKRIFSGVQPSAIQPLETILDEKLWHCKMSMIVLAYRKPTCDYRSKSEKIKAKTRSYCSTFTLRLVWILKNNYLRSI